MIRPLSYADGAAGGSCRGVQMVQKEAKEKDDEGLIVRLLGAASVWRWPKKRTKVRICDIIAPFLSYLARLRRTFSEIRM